MTMPIPCIRRGWCRRRRPRPLAVHILCAMPPAVANSAHVDRRQVMGGGGAAQGHEPLATHRTSPARRLRRQRAPAMVSGGRGSEG